MIRISSNFSSFQRVAVWCEAICEIYEAIFELRPKGSLGAPIKARTFIVDEAVFVKKWRNKVVTRRARPYVDSGRGRIFLCLKFFI